MADGAFFAKVVEVFPMRLGGEVLVDVTLEPESDDFPSPKPEDRLVLPGAAEGDEGPALAIWAAPSIPQAKGPRRLNVQFQRATDGVDRLAEGQRVELRPARR